MAYSGNLVLKKRGLERWRLLNLVERDYECINYSN